MGRAHAHLCREPHQSYTLLDVSDSIPRNEIHKAVSAIAHHAPSLVRRGFRSRSVLPSVWSPPFGQVFAVPSIAFHLPRLSSHPLDRAFPEGKEGKENCQKRTFSGSLHTPPKQPKVASTFGIPARIQ